MDNQLKEGGSTDCLIISANTVVSPYPVYPLGAAYIVKALKDNGHRVCHFDLLADGGLEKLTSFLKNRHFDLVGVSIRNIDTVDSASSYGYLDGVIDIVTCIRRELDTTLVLGGAGFSIMPEKLLDYFGGDYGVVGEGESIIVWLASELAAGRKPQKKLLESEHRQGAGRWPALSSETVSYYAAHGGMLNIQTKRGCPHTCSYCSYPAIEGRNVRYRSPEEIADEAFELKEKHGVRYLFFADSVFNDTAGHYLDVAEALIKREVSLPWCAFFRPQNITRKQLKLLKRSGLTAMELGTDAATDETLDGIRKGFSFDDVLATHDLVVSEDIPCAHFIMFGGPNENEQTVAKGLKNIEKLDKCVVFAFIGIRVLPGTELFDRAVADGIIKYDQSLISPVFYYSPEIGREKIEHAVTRSFADNPDRVFPCHKFYNRISMLHEMGHAGPLWDLLLKKRR